MRGVKNLTTCMITVTTPIRCYSSAAVTSPGIRYRAFISISTRKRSTCSLYMITLTGKERGEDTGC